MNYIIKISYLTAATMILLMSGMHSAQAITLKFVQQGLQGGGIFSITVVVEDLNGDGYITSGGIIPGPLDETTELKSVSARLRGNTILPDFDIASTTEGGSMAYTLGTPFLDSSVSVPGFIGGSKEALLFEHFIEVKPGIFDGAIDYYSGGISDLGSFLSVSGPDPITGVGFTKVAGVSGPLALVPIPASAALYLGGLAFFGVMFGRRKRGEA